MQSDSMLVVTCLGDVPDPLGWLVVTLLLNPQIPYSQTTACEHGNLYHQSVTLFKIEGHLCQS